LGSILVRDKQQPRFPNHIDPHNKTPIPSLTKTHKGEGITFIIETQNDKREISFMRRNKEINLETGEA
jgi:hypothetical protein